MKNAKDYKALVYELIDLYNRQREIVNYLTEKVSETDNNEHFLSALQKYLEEITKQEGALAPVIGAVEISIYKDSANKFEKNATLHE